MATSDEPIEQKSEPQRNLRLAAANDAPPGARRSAHTDVTPESGHLLDYVRLLHKRRWTAGTAFLLVLASVTTYTFTVTPVYEAKTRLLIEAEGPNVINFAEVIDEQRSKADYYQTQYNILQSRLLARKTIDSLQLWDSPSLGASHSDFFASLFGYGASSAAPKGPQNATETFEQSRAIDRFLENLSVYPIRNSRLGDLKYRLSASELAMPIVTAI